MSDYLTAYRKRFVAEGDEEAVEAIDNLRSFLRTDGRTATLRNIDNFISVWWGFVQDDPSVIPPGEAAVMRALGYSWGSDGSLDWAPKERS